MNPARLAPVIGPARMHELAEAIRGASLALGHHAVPISILIHATRQHPALALGASPRGSLALYHTAQARAALQSRDYVLPDDVKYVAVAGLAHRMMMNPENALSGETTDQVVAELLKSVEVPLVNKPG